MPRRLAASAARSRRAAARPRSSGDADDARAGAGRAAASGAGRRLSRPRDRAVEPSTPPGRSRGTSGRPGSSCAMRPSAASAGSTVTPKKQALMIVEQVAVVRRRSVERRGASSAPPAWPAKQHDDPAAGGGVEGIARIAVERLRVKPRAPARRSWECGSCLRALAADFAGFYAQSPCRNQSGSAAAAVADQAEAVDPVAAALAVLDPVIVAQPRGALLAPPFGGDPLGPFDARRPRARRRASGSGADSRRGWRRAPRSARRRSSSLSGRAWNASSSCAAGSGSSGGCQRCARSGMWLA